MGDSFTAVPSTIAGLGGRFVENGALLGETGSGFGGNALQVADAFGLLGACDGAMEKYISMAQSTVQGLEQLAQLWQQTGEQLVSQSEAYQACEEEQQQRFQGIRQELPVSAEGGH
jgi:hypothetical protein